MDVLSYSGLLHLSSIVLALCFHLASGRNAVCTVDDGTTTDTSTSHSVQYDVTCNCDVGYQLIRPQPLTNGTLRLMNPLCQGPQECYIEEIDNGRSVVTGFLPDQENVTYTCNPGYQLIGEASPHCDNGTLVKPTCQAIYCPVEP
eukprot:scpid101005/ scgid35528/ 